MSKHGIISEWFGCLNGLLFEIKCCLKQNVEILPIILLWIFLLLWLKYSTQLWCKYTLHILHYCCPGKSPYQATLEKLSLHSIISQLPLGLSIIGYAAYTESDPCLHHSQDPAVSTLAKTPTATSWVRCKYKLRHHWAYWQISGKFSNLQCSQHCHAHWKYSLLHPGYTILSFRWFRGEIKNIYADTPWSTLK